MITRYIVLAGMSYYPARWDDYRGEFATIEAAVACGKHHLSDDSETYCNWYQVIDLMTKKVVADEENS